MKTNSPEISILIVVRNEEKHILPCIKSMEQQLALETKWELIIIDGMSEDNTVAIASQYLNTCDYSWKILDNPKRILASGWNIGIKAAQAPLVMRVDAHAELLPGYIESGLQTLRELPDVSAVGGQLKTIGKGFFGKIIQAALSSRVAMGNSSFRTSAKSGYYDTAVYALYRKKTLLECGLLNESLIRHQDNDLHLRIKNLGGKFYLNENMKAIYYCRSSIPAVLKQMFLIGYYIPDIFFSGACSKRHVIPFLFYLGILLSMAFYPLSPVFPTTGAAIFFAYLFVIFTFCIGMLLKEKNIFLLLNCILIPCLHMAYASGTALGFLRKLGNQS
jgi:glycosyltransferase involved in cell wall biosynthesis